MKKVPFIILGVILLLLFVVGSAQIYANKKAEEAISDFLKTMELEDIASYESVSYSLLTGVTEVENLRLSTSEGETLIEKVAIRKVTDTDVELSMLRIHPAETPELRDMKDKVLPLGKSEVVMNIHISAGYYEKEGQLKVRDFSVEFPDMFTMSIKLDMSGVNKEFIKEVTSTDDDPQKINKLAADLAKVYLNSFSVSFKDTGFIKAMLEKEAKNKGKSPEELRKEILSDLKKMSKSKNEFEKTFAEVSIKLIEKGGKLTIISQPSEPVGFQEIIILSLMGMQTKNFQPLVEKLNLKAEHSL